MWGKVVRRMRQTEPKHPLLSPIQCFFAKYTLYRNVATIKNKQTNPKLKQNT